MRHSILLRGAKQLLTLRGTTGVRRGSDFDKLEIIEDGSVFIQDGKIASVGSTRRLENLKEARDALVIPVPNCVVMPGFVDPAIQLNLNARDSAGRIKRRKLSDFAADCVTTFRGCLQHGTLNVGVRAKSGISSLRSDLALLRQLNRISTSPVSLTRIWQPDVKEETQNPRAYTDALKVILRQKLAQRLELSKNVDHPTVAHLLQMSDRTPLGVNLRLQPEDEVKLEAALNCVSPISLHCPTTLSKENCLSLASMPAVNIFNVHSTLLQEPANDNIRALIDAGGRVALASGYDAVDEPNFNMQLVLAIAVMRLRLTIEQAIVATTINAAHALGLGDSLGSLEPGKRAEIVVLNLSDYREIPRRLGLNHLALAIRDGSLAINRTRWKVGAA